MSRKTGDNPLIIKRQWHTLFGTVPDEEIYLNYMIYMSMNAGSNALSHLDGLFYHYCIRT